ncbi:Outer membrane usher protein FaeD [Vibrio crassostreae]|nr:outer membrane usher protein FimD/PapC [Vibrio crassostreae]TCT75394.1 outer membrane usher protein FimD/PapC [Vibrio crassostreae]TCT95948.1 outer membrane usher protein FimD/PapC [Vibrio crassostreae]CAK2110854.1 Outer membrane usher protein FaeD [Vibrio crassostreae]CAK2120835.1 Outer membrane usher protein FaeD [Vibrio crassostreae]
MIVGRNKPLMIIKSLVLGVVVFQSDFLIAGELNWDFLQGGRDVDKSAFDNLSSRYIPGRYLVDVELNSRLVGKRILTITEQERDILCLTSVWLDDARVSIDAEFYAPQFNEVQQCYQLDQEPNSEVNFDFSTQKLAFKIPQMGLSKEVKPLKWDYGVSALRASYSANISVNDVNTTLYGNLGLIGNVGRWVTTTSVSAINGGVNIPMLTASRALYNLKADLTIGKTFTGNSLIGGGSLLGFGLASNNSMLPSEVGYTPVFSGIANGDARVTLIQNGNVIYSEIVPSGPFEIRDINLLSSGDVIMRITEADGTQREQFFPLTIVSGMLSPEEVEYGVYSGVRESGSGELPGVFAAANFGYGFKTHTLRSSTLIHAKYGAAGAEIVTSLGRWGVFGLYGALSHSQYDDGVAVSGAKASVTYSKTLGKDTDIQLSSTQYTKEQYVEFSGFTPDHSPDVSRSERNQYNFSLGHRLLMDVRSSVSAWHRTYWSDSDTSTGINGTVSSRVGFFDVSLGGNFSQVGGKESYSASLSVSMPFSAFDQDISSYATMNVSNNGNANYSSGVAISVNDKLDYSADVGGANSRNNATYNLRSNYYGNRAQASGQISKTGSSVTGSVSVRGSVIALPVEEDVIFTRNISDTIVVANVGAVEGVEFTASPYPSNAKGHAVVPVSAYRENNITLSGDTLPVDVELLDTSLKLTPTSRAVVYLPFESVKVKRYLFQIRDQQGDFVPTGSWAMTDDGVPLGFVSQNGVLFVNSVDVLTAFSINGCRVSSSVIKETTTLQEVQCD